MKTIQTTFGESKLRSNLLVRSAISEPSGLGFRILSYIIFLGNTFETIYNMKCYFNGDRFICTQPIHAHELIDARHELIDACHRFRTTLYFKKCTYIKCSPRFLIG